MRRALDREMPEPSRRRPVLLIWILGLLLPTAGGLAWMLFSPGHPGLVPRVEIGHGSSDATTPGSAALHKDNALATH